eukprot:scaffold7548_cov106-Skeletonema_marinoi.AAC.8
MNRLMQRSKAVFIYLNLSKNSTDASSKQERYVAFQLCEVWFLLCEVLLFVRKHAGARSPPRCPKAKLKADQSASALYAAHSQFQALSLPLLMLSAVCKFSSAPTAHI